MDSTTVRIPVDRTELVGHLWTPDGPGPHPIVVLGHGLGAVQDMGLATYATAFADAGVAALTFDYRGFGESGGTPRQVIDIGRQLADWAAAVSWTRAQDGLDAERVALWGTSFAGGHVLEVARRDGRIAAVVSQCPFTDGLASFGAARPADVSAGGSAAALVTLVGRAIADQGAGLLGRPPVTVPVYGPTGSTALLSAPDCEAGYAALVPEGSTFRNEVGARLALHIATYRPGRALASLTSCPVLVCICEHDSVAPASAAHRHAATCPTAEVATFACGHFDIYAGHWQDEAIERQVGFLAGVLLG